LTSGSTVQISAFMFLQFATSKWITINLSAELLLHQVTALI
jgi:hypothetical protein